MTKMLNSNPSMCLNERALDATSFLPYLRTWSEEQPSSTGTQFESLKEEQRILSSGLPLRWEA